MTEQTRPKGKLWRPLSYIIYDINTWASVEEGDDGELTILLLSLRLRKQTNGILYLSKLD